VRHAPLFKSFFTSFEVKYLLEAPILKYAISNASLRTDEQEYNFAGVTGLKQARDKRLQPERNRTGLVGYHVLTVALQRQQYVAERKNTIEQDRMR
jgi:hypothetical protein